MKVFYLLLISHLIADCFLQVGSIGNKKRGLNKQMLIHIFTVTILFLVPLYNQPLAKSLLGALVIFLSHLLTDVIKVEISRILKLEPSRYLYWTLFGVDQIIHVSIIYLVVNHLL